MPQRYSVPKRNPSAAESFPLRWIASMFELVARSGWSCRLTSRGSGIASRWSKVAGPRDPPVPPRAPRTDRMLEPGRRSPFGSHLEVHPLVRPVAANEIDRRANDLVRLELGVDHDSTARPLQRRLEALGAMRSPCSRQSSSDLASTRRIGRGRSGRAEIGVVKQERHAVAGHLEVGLDDVHALAQRLLEALDRVRVANQ